MCSCTAQDVDVCNDVLSEKGSPRISRPTRTSLSHSAIIRGVTVTITARAHTAVRGQVSHWSPNETSSPSILDLREIEPQARADTGGSLRRRTVPRDSTNGPLSVCDSYSFSTALDLILHTSGSHLVLKGQVGHAAKTMHI